ncbi:MAG: hypothetical protein ACD_22C00194G0002, partial [uncultured bacterium]
MTAAILSAFVKDPPHTSFDGEDSGEKVTYVLRKSFITNIGWIFLTLLFIFIPAFVNTLFVALDIESPGFISSNFAFILNAAWYLFTFGYIFERFLNWFFNVYIITNKRIVDMDFYSFLYRKVSDAPLRNIEDITYDVKGYMAALFNYGDVTIQTAA